MRAGGSKQKGSAYERDICKKLSLWASSGKREDCFWRSAMSGGRSTIQIRKGKQNTSQAGDISSIDRIGAELIEQFCIECKHYKTLDLIPGIIHNRGALYSFWNKVVEDAFAIRKMPLLIAKQNRLPSLILMTEIGACTLNLRRGKCVCHLPQWGCDIYLLDDVLAENFFGSPPRLRGAGVKEKLHVSL